MPDLWKKVKPLWLYMILFSLKQMNFSSLATDIMMASLPNSIGRYGLHLNDFGKFCENRKRNNFLNMACAMGMKFSTESVNAGSSYSTINTARSAIAQFIIKGMLNRASQNSRQI